MRIRYGVYAIRNIQNHISQTNHSGIIEVGMPEANWFPNSEAVGWS
jgi:hypothetical protein